MEPSKGFVVVASKRSNFYLYAINLMETVKDYYPEDKLTFGNNNGLQVREENTIDLDFRL